MKFIFLIILALVFLSCGEQQRNSVRENSTLALDTIIGSVPIMDEIAGSAYRKKAKGYFVIVKKDTSEYMPIITESREDSSVYLQLNIPYSNNNFTHAQRIAELELIFSKASKEFNFDSLRAISVGRLIQNGELSIAVTNQFLDKYGAYRNIRTTDYQMISGFLLESRLAEDFNNLLKPYNLSVENINIEKAFFASKQSFIFLNTFKVDSSAIPEKILDCITWIKLKKRK